jgi:dihydrofolate reductase
LTHHSRESIEMEGGTTFHFVTEGIAVALDRAREAAGERNVCIGGGASTVNQVLAAGQLDELYLHIVAILLGGGERLFVDVGDPALEVIEAVTSPAATHVRYRVVR